MNLQVIAGISLEVVFGLVYCNKVAKSKYRLLTDMELVKEVLGNFSKCSRNLFLGKPKYPAYVSDS